MAKKLKDPSEEKTTPPLRGTPPQEGNAQAKNSPPAEGRWLAAGKGQAKPDGMAPKLRFPEFRNSEAWPSRRLNELLFEAKQRNRQLEYGPQDVLSVSGEFGCVNQIEFMGRSYAGVTVKDYHIVGTGDIVYTKSPLKKNPFGIIKENKGKPGIVSTLYAVYRPTELTYPPFLNHYFSSDYNLNSYLQPLVKKGAKNDMKVNNAYVLSGEIFAPRIEEQRKIADFLTSLDEVITAEAQSLDALKAHKKGLMQQLFPAEGETVPKRRFPDFKDSGEWEAAPFQSVCENISSGRDKASANGKFDLYGSTGIIGKTENATYEGRYLLVARVGANAGHLTLADGKFGITDNTLVISLKASAHLNFIFFSLSQFGLNKLIFGSGQPLITGTQLKELPICFPTSIGEQRQIAACLTSLDELIAAQAAKIEALKAQKKGLLQGLFPVSAL